MKSLVILAAFIVLLLEVVADEEDQRRGNGQQWGAGGGKKKEDASVLIKKIVDNLDKLQRQLKPVGGMDGAVRFLKSKDTNKLGFLVDAYERAQTQFRDIEQRKKQKPNDFLKQISDLITSVNGVLDQFGGASGIWQWTNMLYNGASASSLNAAAVSDVGNRQ